MADNIEVTAALPHQGWTLRLDAHQEDAILSGQPAPFIIQGTEYVHVRKRICEHAQRLGEDDILDADTT